MGQQLVRQTVRRSALDAQAARSRERVDRERRLAGLAVQVLTALGDRHGAVRDAKRHAGEALRTMADDEGLSVPRPPTVAAVSSRPALIKAPNRASRNLCCSLLLCTARQARGLGG
jgi:hypothetical protein